MSPPGSGSPLGREIVALIAAEGPIGVDRFMQLALAHPVHGYYMTRDPFGRSGDFVTAPEISQMYGELIGLWAAATWTALGRPRPVRLVELGPGRGTLMADALRAGRALPGFVEAIDLRLVETSPALKARQAEALASSGLQPTWHANLVEVPAGPALVLASEFLDALPIRQYFRAERGWHERLVGLDARGELAFGLTPLPRPVRDALAGSAPPGSVLELGVAAAEIVAGLSARLVRDGGAALLIDYGPATSGFGDTLQAVRGHRHVPPLAQPGEADLTAHVDFCRLARIAEAAGAAVHGPVPQADFLEALGIRERAARLGSDPLRRTEVGAALDRLTDRASTGMGTLFKVMGVSDPVCRALPGLTEPRPADARAIEEALC